MTKIITISIIVIVILLSITIPVVSQTASCPGKGSIVQVIPDFELYVRPKPGGNLPGNSFSPPKSVTSKAGRLTIDDIARVGSSDYLHIVGVGWIWNRYLSIECATTTTVPVVIRSQTATLSTPASIDPTPTRISVQIVYCASAPSVVKLEPELWRVECDFRK